MVEKQDWIKFIKTHKEYKDCRDDVINFIADILFFSKEDTIGVISQLFSSGYCYYFANMLKTAFKRGTICWHRNFGHILWVDDNGIPYDIYGPNLDYDESDLLPADEALGDMIVDFMHNGKEYKAPDDFHKWLLDNNINVTDIYAMQIIYMNIPRSKINDNISVTDNAYAYWKTYRHIVYRLLYNKEGI